MKNIKLKILVPMALALIALFSMPLVHDAPIFAQGDTADDSSLPANSDQELKDINGALSDGQSPSADCKGVKIAFDVGCMDDFDNPILAYLVAIVRFLTYGIGIVVVLMIVVGGIQYAAAGDNAQSVSAAKNRILNAFIALLLFIFAFAILNFVVPGGLIG